jgi:NAD(P)H dehydrogenase (quinone)
VKAIVVVGHPAPNSFNHALAIVVADAWRALGCDVAWHDLTAEGFDPRLTAAEVLGETTMDPLVRIHIAALVAADLLCVVHPNCWGAPPAIMKGWIDRVFAPNAAYGFAKGADAGDAPAGLLPLRGALVLNTGNTPVAREDAVFGDPLGRIWRDCVLGYCSKAHVERALFGVVATSTAAERADWLVQAGDMALALHNHAFA